MFVNINYLDYYTLCKAKLMVYKVGWLRETVRKREGTFIPNKRIKSKKNFFITFKGGSLARSPF